MALLTDNLEAFWELEEASGTRVDAHGANDLTDNNTVGVAVGKVGNAADFELANSEYLSIADNASLSMGDIDFTLAGWVQLESKPASITTIIGKYTALLNQREYRFIWFNTPDRFAFQVSPEGITTALVQADLFGAPSLATLYFIIAEHDATNNLLTISVNNGTPNTNVHTTGVFNGSAQFNLGATLNTVGTLVDFWDGLQDQMGIWKRLLSSNEKSFLYNNGNGRSYAEIATAGDLDAIVADQFLTLGVG